LQWFFPTQTCLFSEQRSFKIARRPKNRHYSISSSLASPSPRP
jgi:hypothetical protein